MARRNVSIPDELDDQAREAGLNVSALTQQAIAAELDRRARMARLGEWLDQLDHEHGPPAAEAMAEARAWIDAGRPAKVRRDARRPSRRAETTPRKARAARPADAAR